MTDEGVSLGVGMYLNDRTYVKVEQGSELGSREVSINVDLTRRLRLRGFAGVEARSGVGIEWRKDY
jgi:translocation and assembly module TamB